MGSDANHLKKTCAAVAASALLLVACSGNKSGSSPSGQGADAGTFAAAVASTDMYAGTPQRFQLGISWSSQSQGVKLVTFGQIALAFTYLGTTASATPVAGPQVSASYLAAPTTLSVGAGPALSDPNVARGVYQAENLTFDQAGIWQVDVTADVAGQGVQHLSAAFPIASKPSLPAPGQKALHTVNLTIASKNVPTSAIDSAALDGKPVPDPELHRWTIAAALDQHRPILVIFGTPTYCVSRWCGPNVEAVAALAKQYAKKAVFIHVEIWRDFQKSIVNKAAADWLYRNGDLVDPWLFLVGSNGIVLDRWAPLFDPAEVAKELAALPNMKP
jgi:hypothetical protein